MEKQNSSKKRPFLVQSVVTNIAEDTNKGKKKRSDRTIPKPMPSADESYGQTPQSPSPVPEMATSVSSPGGSIGYDHSALFIQKTYDMVSNDSYSDVVSWTDCGQMIVIKDMNRFETEILPSYFDSKKFSSFKRQLHFYGFSKKQSPANGKGVIFANHNFKRGKEDLLCHINRGGRQQSKKPSGIDDYNSFLFDQRLKTMLENQNNMLNTIQRLDSNVQELQNQNRDLVNSTKLLEGMINSLVLLQRNSASMNLNLASKPLSMTSFASCHGESLPMSEERNKEADRNVQHSSSSTSGLSMARTKHLCPTQHDNDSKPPHQPNNGELQVEDLQAPIDHRTSSDMSSEFHFSSSTEKFIHESLFAKEAPV